MENKSVFGCPEVQQRCDSAKGECGDNVCQVKRTLTKGTVCILRNEEKLTQEMKTTSPKKEADLIQKLQAIYPKKEDDLTQKLKMTSHKNQVDPTKEIRQPCITLAQLSSKRLFFVRNFLKKKENN